MDSNKTAGEEARRQLHKNAASNLEQVLGATPNETPTVRATLPPITKTIQVSRHYFIYLCFKRVLDITSLSGDFEWFS